METIKIGPFTYKIVWDANNEDHGESKHWEQELIINPGQARDNQADTLLHEVMHAAFFAAGIDVANEEQIVRPLSTWLLMIIRENPQLIEFIKGN